jgi:hypothetical protein
MTSTATTTSIEKGEWCGEKSKTRKQWQSKNAEVEQHTSCYAKQTYGAPAVIGKFTAVS